MTALTDRVRIDAGLPHVAARPVLQPPKPPLDNPEFWLNMLPQRPILESVRARHAIYRAGHAIEGVPVICEGWAACVGQLFDGRRQVLSILLPGDLFSAATVFVGRLNFSIEAITPVRYARLDRDSLTASIASDPRIFKAVIEASISEKGRSDQLAIDLGRRTASERLARVLLHLKNKVAARGLLSDNCFDMPLRQQHLADATGLTPVHVNRTLGSFRRNGLIEIADGKLTILNETALQRTADVG